MSQSPADVAAKWAQRVNAGGARYTERERQQRATRGMIAAYNPPMSEDHVEKLLAHYREWYATGRMSLEQLEASVTLALRAYYDSPPA